MSAPTTPRDPFVEITLTVEEVAEIERKFNKDEYDSLDIEALLVSHERLRAKLLALQAVERARYAALGVLGPEE